VVTENDKKSYISIAMRMECYMYSPKNIITQIKVGGEFDLSSGDFS
jgi:hypothetical protein